ncbi:GlcG/HbpS family heme-binding protein [Limosilactobacillus reuteri]|uniref:GlcG/HbpS family heme-binding protein n=1 Tax=Limosilactobacillus reuteri TaxID=1598 RepID=UPI000A1DF88C|nr:heme-binding protein [Limosilactobacillus reuteri]MCC4440786.1 heme-binding protein [Limosilactobacillus reuteri]
MNSERIEKIVKRIIDEQQENNFSLEKMQKVVKAAVAQANKLNIGVTIVIMKSDQVVQMSYHMPNAILVSCTMAPKKAWTALAMGEPTKNLTKDVQPGAELYQMETMMDGKFTSCGGGIPLKVGKKIIGAIGVSGGSVEQDHEICMTAVKTFLKESE